MTKIHLLFGCISAGLALCCCAFPGLKTDSPQRAMDRRDSLILFREIIASGNFQRAVSRIHKSERTALLDQAGKVKEDAKPRLRALRLRNLLNSNQVRLRGGGLRGIVEVMPGTGSGEGCSEEDFETSGESAADSLREIARNQTHSAARLFFDDIRSGVWQFPLNDMHPATRSLFVDHKGRIPKVQAARLRGIDTSRWECLSLIDGKIVGVMSILPKPPEELETVFLAFRKSIHGGEWAAAMDILREDEKRILTFPAGRINPAYTKRLLGLRREDWDRFSWEAGKLSGFTDWLDIDSKPMN